MWQSKKLSSITLPLSKLFPLAINCYLILTAFMPTEECRYLIFQCLKVSSQCWAADSLWLSRFTNQTILHLPYLQHADCFIMWWPSRGIRIPWNRKNQFHMYSAMNTWLDMMEQLQEVSSDSPSSCFWEMGDLNAIFCAKPRKGIPARFCHTLWVLKSTVPMCVQLVEEWERIFDLHFCVWWCGQTLMW